MILSAHQAYHAIDVEGKEDQEKTVCDVVGPICESGDFFAKNIELPSLEHDDLWLLKVLELMDLP